MRTAVQRGHATWTAVARSAHRQSVPLGCNLLRPGNLPSISTSNFDIRIAARPRRNRRTMWAGPRMSEECADLVGRFRRKDVLELAGLLLDLRFAVHGQTVGKKAF